MFLFHNTLADQHGKILSGFGGPLGPTHQDQSSHLVDGDACLGDRQSAALAKVSPILSTIPSWQSNALPFCCAPPGRPAGSKGGSDRALLGDGLGGTADPVEKALTSNGSVGDAEDDSFSLSNGSPEFVPIQHQERFECRAADSLVPVDKRVVLDQREGQGGAPPVCSRRAW